MLTVYLDKLSRRVGETEGADRCRSVHPSTAFLHAQTEQQWGRSDVQAQQTLPASAPARQYAQWCGSTDAPECCTAITEQLLAEAIAQPLGLAKGLHQQLAFAAQLLALHSQARAGHRLAQFAA